MAWSGEYFFEGHEVWTVPRQHLAQVAGAIGQPGRQFGLRRRSDDAVRQNGGLSAGRFDDRPARADQSRINSERAQGTLKRTYVLRAIIGLPPAPGTHRDVRLLG